MIQRIQSLYILVVIILYTLLAFSPLVKFFGDDWIILDAFSISKTEKTIPLTILIGIIICINLIIIFLYKNRILQIRLLVMSLVLLIGSIVLIGFYTYQILKEDGLKAYYQIACIYPLISIIFTILAIFAIRKDNALVRSIDRIR